MPIIRKLIRLARVCAILFLWLSANSTFAKNEPRYSLKINQHTFSASVGRSGLTDHKTEGDGATPIGNFHLREIFYRADRIDKNNLSVNLPLTPIDKNDAWCDEVKSPDYNHFVKLPRKGSYENLWREDHLYDIIVVVGYNDRPVIKAKGSAIFLHIASPDFLPTAGCIAFTKKDLLKILPYIKPTSVLHIKPGSITLTDS